MKIFRKIVAVLTAAVMAVSAFAAVSVTAGADSIENTAAAIISSKLVSTNIPNDYDKSDYKITVSDSGTLKMSVESYVSEITIIVYNSNGEQIKPQLYEATSGSVSWNFMGTYCSWNKTIEKFQGTLKYSVRKGTYYIRFENYQEASSMGNYNAYNNEGEVNFTATYPSATSAAKLNYITINMERGDTISLGADMTGTGSVTWKSSKPKVATVSSTGKITAKSKGTTVISAKCGKTTRKIKIKVS